MDTVSENETVYRAEYLAYRMFQDIMNDKTELGTAELLELPDEEFQKQVQSYISSTIFGIRHLQQQAPCGGKHCGATYTFPC